jgi:hypothetical protein
MSGASTQWYRNVLQNQLIAFPVTDAKAVESVVEKFRENVRRKGREEVLFEIRCGGCGSTDLNTER